MGGAAGHVMHLHDNSMITFGDIKNVLSLAAEGRLTKVSEKLDGVNLMFTYRVGKGGLRVARTELDLPKGGMSQRELLEKYKGRGAVADAFSTGFDTLNAALDAIDDEMKKLIFGDKLTRWFSIEIIYSGLSNTINYDKDHIVFHGWPVFDVVGETVLRSQSDVGIDVINKNITKMQAAVASRNWGITGPALVRLKKLGDGRILQKAVDSIDMAMWHANVKDTDTIMTYIAALAWDEGLRVGLTSDAAAEVAARIAKQPNRFTLAQLKKRYPSQASTIDALIKDEKSLKRKWMQPIEQAIHDFSVEVLKGLRSALIADSEAEVERLRSLLTRSIEAIKASGHEESMDVLNRHMSKLKDIENIASPVEGVVFIYKGQAYKFTGAFAPAHQIISLFTYGKGDVTFSAPTTGLAFTNVCSITQDQYHWTAPHIIDDIKKLGAMDIQPVGSTGKKKVMSDIDVVVEHYDDEKLHAALVESLGKQNVRKVGRNTSIRYPIFDENGPTNKYVQVDLMLGEANFVSWARFGTTPEEDHPDYSRVKGAFRNLLLNKTLSIISSHQPLLESTSAGNRKRLALDFDRGLYLIEQTRIGKRKEILKNWKTTKRDFISSDPDDIAYRIFGEEFDKSNTRTFEEVLHAVLTSEHTSFCSEAIVKGFLEDVEMYAEKNSKMFNGDPWETVDYIRSLVEF